jgi:hypothetical protein
MKANPDSKARQIEKVEIINFLFNYLKSQKGKFSLRKFAKLAKVDPSSLSQYLRLKRSLSDYNYNLIIENLTLDPGLKLKYEEFIHEKLPDNQAS